MESHGYVGFRFWVEGSVNTVVLVWCLVDYSWYFAWSERVYMCPARTRVTCTCASPRHSFDALVAALTRFPRDVNIAEWAVNAIVECITCHSIWAQVRNRIGALADVHIWCVGVREFQSVEAIYNTQFDARVSIRACEFIVAVCMISCALHFRHPWLPPLVLD